jgi:hypothetical protein
VKPGVTDPEIGDKKRKHFTGVPNLSFWRFITIVTVSFSTECLCIKIVCHFGSGGNDD